MLRWLFTILLGLLLLYVSFWLYRFDPESWPMSLVVLGFSFLCFFKAMWISKSERCPECGKSFAKGKEKVVEHPVRFWHAEKRVTRYRPCKECCHRMDVRKKTVPRYWFEPKK